MPIPNDIKELTDLFKRLGAEQPENWASSQINEGIPQILRYAFLKQAWDNVVSDDDHSWIENEIDRSKKQLNDPYSGLGIALEQCLDKGVENKNLTEMARCLQASMIFHLGYLIDGPAYPMDKTLEDINWGLFQIDENGKPIGSAISGIYESVLEFDPTGREMRPKNNF